MPYVNEEDEVNLQSHLLGLCPVERIFPVTVEASIDHMFPASRPYFPALVSLEDGFALLTAFLLFPKDP